MKASTFCILCVALAAGCASRPMPQAVVVSAPAAPPLTSDKLEAIRYPGLYRAYSVGRRIDPQNPRVMYEGGKVYVREVPDRWNLHPQPGATVPMGPNVAPANAAYSPLPIAEELKLELNTQKQSTKAVLEQAVQLRQAVGELAPVAQKMAGQQQQVLRHLLTTDERLRLLEERLRQGNSPVAPGPISTNRAPEDW